MTAIEPHVDAAQRLGGGESKCAKSSPKRRASKSFCLRLPDGRDTCRSNMLRSGSQRPTDTKHSAASRLSCPPEDECISLTVERVENGEVSHYLVDELRCGDRFELRGPLGATSYAQWPWEVLSASSEPDRA